MDLSCVHASHGLRFTNDGKIQPCCYFDTSIFYQDENGNDMNASTHTFEQIRNSPTAIKLRKDLKNGVRHPGCSRCWREEDNGGDSKRLRDMYHLKWHNLQGTTFVELNLGNTCNFACRMCGISASSKWYNDDYEISYSNMTSDEYKEFVNNFSKGYSDVSIFWAELEKNLPNLISIDMYGGEPMLVKRQWEFLEKAIAGGYNSNINLHFNTNGSIFQENYADILKKFKKTTISFSIDGIGDKFEYIRYGGKWELVSKNMHSWINRLNQLDNVEFDICCTVSNLNIFYLDEILNGLCNEFTGIRVYLNEVNWPVQYQVWNVHPNIRTVITNRITKFADSLDNTALKQMVLKTIGIMNTTKFSEKNYQTFLNVNGILDKNRNQNFSDVFSEYYQLIDANLNLI